MYVMSTKKRLSVTLDPAVLHEAMRLTGARSKRETLDKALRELVRTERRRLLAESLGAGIFQTTEAELRQRRRKSYARN